MTTAPTAHSYEANAQQFTFTTTAPETEFLGTMPWAIEITWFGRQGICARNLGHPCVIRISLIEESAGEDSEGSRRIRRTHIGKEFSSLHVEVFDRQNGQTIAQVFRLKDYLPDRVEDQDGPRNGRPRLLLIRLEGDEHFSLRWVDDTKTTHIDMVPLCRAIEAFIDLLSVGSSSQRAQSTPSDQRTTIEARTEEDGMVVITDDE